MNEQQLFNMNLPFKDGYEVLFVKLVLVIIIFYVLLLVLNFLRDKFINKTSDTKKEDITTLLIVLNKLFVLGGYGFVVASILNGIISLMTRKSNFPKLSGGDWDFLLFGILLIFIGIAFKASRKVLKKESQLVREDSNKDSASLT